MWPTAAPVTEGTGPQLKKLLIATLLAVVPPAAMAGQDASLVDIYQNALDYNARFAAEQDRLRARREVLPQARSAFLPEIGVEAQWGYTDERTRLDLGLDEAVGPAADLAAALGISERFDSRFETRQGAVQVVQPLYRGENFARLEQARSQVSAAELALELAHQDLILQVAEAYFQLQLGNETVRLAEAELASVNTQLERARHNLEAGIGSRTDVNEALARRDQVQAEKISARNERDLAGQQLQQLAGPLPGPLTPISPEFRPSALDPPQPDHWANLARRYNLTVQLAHRDLEIARQEIQYRRAAHQPRVDLIGRYGRRWQDEGPFGVGDRLDVEGGSVTVQLSMPLYTGGLTTSRVRQSEAERDAALQELTEIRRGAGLRAQEASRNLNSGRERILALEQALRSARSTEQAVSEGLAAGLRTTADLLQAKQQRYAVERQLAAARYAYLLGYLELQAAVGLALDGNTVREVDSFLRSSNGDG